MMRAFCLMIGLLSLQGAGWARADAALEAQGNQVFANWCLPCHGDGPNFPGTTALRAKYQGQIEPILANRADMTPEFIKLIVRTGISVMPHSRKTEISDQDLEALAAYLTRQK